MDQQVLADSIKHALRISHREEGWISPFLDVVKEASADAARWKPAPEVPSIWELVAHAVPYTESRLSDLGGNPDPIEEDWPTVSDTSDAAWAALQARVEGAVTKMETLVNASSPEELATPGPGKERPRAERLIDIAIHDAYHAGQIIKLTQLYAAIGREAVPA